MRVEDRKWVHGEVLPSEEAPESISTVNASSVPYHI
jgi:hypothetical protein